MKRVICILVVSCLFQVSNVFSQSAPDQGKKEEHRKLQPVKAPPASTNSSEMSADGLESPVGKGKKLKKDGTPDKRFKENKQNPEATEDKSARKKKDGTPDKRYKENKAK